MGIFDFFKKKQKEVIKSPEEKKWKKINSWEDVDLNMALISGKYRIQILEELMGMEHPTYTWQQHLRRIMILGKDSKKSIEEVNDDYIKKISVLTEHEKKEEKVINEIYKETDLIKQNILIDNEIENDPNLLELYNIKAYNLYELEKVKEGIETIMKAIKINPERAGFYDTAGEGYYMIEEYRNAVDIMSAGIEIAPEGLDPCGRSYLIEDHYYNRGMAYLKLKEYDKAKSDFTHILTIEIGYEKAILALKDIPGFLSEQKHEERFKIIYEDDSKTDTDTRQVALNFVDLLNYLDKKPNLNNIFNELTNAIRNGYTVKRYLEDANCLSGSVEVTTTLISEFSNIQDFMRKMLDKTEDSEVRKDFNAMGEAIDILRKESNIMKGHELNKEQLYWIEVINKRVSVMPLNSEGTELSGVGGGLDDLGKDHFDEYKNNEYRVPVDKRVDVALDRVTGFFSLKEYIESKGSKEQKFHLNASLKGALIYATSLGINVDEYKEKKQGNFDKEYNDLNKLILNDDFKSWHEDYAFLKLVYEKIKTAKIQNDIQLNSFIEQNLKKLTIAELTSKMVNFQSLENILGEFLTECEDNNNTSFEGYIDIEQYHSVVTKSYQIGTEVMIDFVTKGDG